MTSKAAIIANLMSENAALKEKFSNLKDTWSYFQSFCKAHGSTGITDLVVQRDSLLAALVLAYDHIDMAALEISHCKDAAAIRAALASAKGGSA